VFLKVLYRADSRRGDEFNEADCYPIEDKHMAEERSDEKILRNMWQRQEVMKEG
jgi:hypothetical protein